MKLGRIALCLAVLMAWLSSAAVAQTRDRRTYARGEVGYGSLEDDEGGLGKGLSFGVGVGRVLIDEVQAEVSVTRMHHERSLAISWEGDITSATGRVMYRSGGAGSTARLFAGVGAGYYSYSGTVSETVFPTLSSVPTVDRFPYSFRGFTYETGGGLEFGAGNGFIRPELWVMIARGGQSTGGRAPEPPFLVARVGVTAGFRF